MLLDDYLKYAIPYIEKIGYKKHPHIGANNNIYLLIEKDGFINIYLDKHINGEIIHFQKCFNDDFNYEKIINEYFYNVDVFLTFVKKTHLKNIRREKIKKINERVR
jgi:hypothetical protein